MPIAGIDDKRQITATLTVTATGDMLPAQVIYGGKTPACLPNATFPTGWHINTHQTIRQMKITWWHTYTTFFYLML